MIIYFIDNEKFTTINGNTVPLNEISSPDEQTPACEDTLTGEKIWCEKGRIWHRLIGPTLIRPDKTNYFFLKGTYYKNVKDWLKAHPNQDETFQKEMLLKYS